jgi:hypothetical protein
LLAIKDEIRSQRAGELRSLIGPFKLEFDLLLVPLSFMFDVELGASGNIDPFSGHLNLESLTRL